MHRDEMEEELKGTIGDVSKRGLVGLAAGVTPVRGGPATMRRRCGQGRPLAALAV